MTDRITALLGLWLVAGAAVAPAAAAPNRVSVAARPVLSGPACERREVAECQDTARTRAIMCDAFSDRLGCADAVLAAQSACLRTTGCY